jgi:probable rRNA maturation factor
MMEINNLTKRRIEARFLRGVAKIVLEGENRKKAYFSLALVGKKRIRELNRRYRRKDRPTDVLAFPDKEPERLGELVICPEEVKKNAKRFNSTFKKELARVLIHGLLHLLGRDHEKGEKEAEKMFEKENYYLAEVNI